ncbi:MAG: cytochrome c oxidase subunit I [Actinobacteria bacterium ATB1]|nr:cytochrome c oxidase subunit I [Actinobacteria bacterium ATB1]
MATTEVRPDLTPSGEIRVMSPYRAKWLGWFTTTDHKQIAKMYAVTAFFFLLVGGTMALIIRTQLAAPEQTLSLPGLEVTEQVYNELLTMHATVMVFLFLTPMLAAFGNYFVPLQIGAADMAFPRVNAFSYWMVPMGGIVLFLSYFTGGPAAAGWTSYSPLAGPQFSPGNGVNLWIGALAILGISSTLGAINFIVTILKLRAPGMTMLRMPIFCWNMLIQSILILFSFPVVTAGLLLLWIDRNLGGAFFDPANGGNVILYQHIFWYFGHPEVYILILPLMGVISEVIPVFSRKPLFGYKAFVYATLSIAALGTAVWAHHMFTTGAIDVKFFAATSFLISIPTGVKMFNWTATMYKGKIWWNSSMLHAIGFLSMFLIGGITGIFNATGAIDFAIHDTYFVVGHFHYVLVSAALFAMFAGLFYWFPKMTGRKLSERLGIAQVIILFIGVNMTFFPQFALGLQGMPRRIQTYADGLGWGWLNMLSTTGSFLVGTAVLLFVINFFWSRKRGEIVGDNPWDAYTLEWATTSPPPYYNFDALPPIRTERPVFDTNHPDVLAEDEEYDRRVSSHPL